MDTIPCKGWTLFRQREAAGTIWAKVTVESPGRGRIDVYDEAVALGALHDPSSIDSAEAAVKNKYGTGAVLRFLRAVKASCPNVVEWVYERVSGASAFRGERVRA